MVRATNPHRPNSRRASSEPRIRCTQAPNRPKFKREDNQSKLRITLPPAASDRSVHLSLRSEWNIQAIEPSDFRGRNHLVVIGEGIELDRTR